MRLYSSEPRTGVAPHNCERRLGIVRVRDGWGFNQTEVMWEDFSCMPRDTLGLVWRNEGWTLVGVLKSLRALPLVAFVQEKLDVSG